MNKHSSDGLITDLQLAQIHQLSLAELQTQMPAIFHLSGPNKPWNTTRAFKYPLWREEAERFKIYCREQHIEVKFGSARQ